MKKTKKAEPTTEPGGASPRSGAAHGSRCEVCNKPAEQITGCAKCGRMIGPCCEAALPEDEQTGETICEECF
jgi:hypothetical protein